MPIIPWLDERRTVLNARYEACELGDYSIESRQTCKSLESVTVYPTAITVSL